MTASSPSLTSALQRVPSPLDQALQREFKELSRRFARQDWGPAELQGGRLAEALFRYLEWKHSGSFTPLGDQLHRPSLVQNVKSDASLEDGLRFHVRRCAELLMDVRNKRDVAHLGDEIDVDEMDAHLVMRLASWATAEILRVEGSLPADNAQQLIDRLSATRIPLVEEIDGDPVLLERAPSAAVRALILLYHSYPEPMELGKLQDAVGYKNPTHFRDRVLGGEQEEGHIYQKNGMVYLTRKGITWVESHVDMKLEVPGQ